MVVAIRSETKKYLKPKQGFSQFGEGQIPIIIKSYYSAKGEAYTDLSLYFLGIQVLLTDKDYDEPVITFNSLAFVTRLTIDGEDLKTHLNDLDALYKEEASEKSCM